MNSTFPALPPAIMPVLLAWYDHNRRILPWREDPTPYHVWLSEIMLQQTRVDAVISYYLRFLEVLPDTESLAAVPEETLLKLWEGLGYYSRARNLKKAAQQIMTEYGGRIPSDPKELVRLSGIGPYTAAAIASIAFQIPVPSADGNLLRLYARLTGYAESIKTPAAKKAAEAAFLEILSPDRPGDMNQALMDLGATVCLPNGQPLCAQCPLAHHCTAHRLGKETSLPKADPKPVRPVEKRTVLLIRKGNSLLLHKRPGTGLLAGLWEFPNLPGHLSEAEALDFCGKLGGEPGEETSGRPCHSACSETDLRTAVIRPLAGSRHIFTHLVWEMTGYEILLPEDCCDTAATDPKACSGNCRFIPADEILEKYSVPSAFSAYTALLRKKSAL